MVNAPDNTLYYGDNLDVLHEHIADESVDLIYLDPPFNSNADYNVLFAEKSGEKAHAQFKAFGDTWTWDTEAAANFQLALESGGQVATAMLAFKTFLGPSDMLAYLSNMAPRLVELRRVLKPTGSIYLHCDPTASHYLKLLMDAIFGPANFKSEIIWKRSSAHSDAKQGRMQHGRIHDIILFYTKSEHWKWNWLYTPYDEAYLKAFYKHTEPETGRVYRLDNLIGPGGGAKGNPRYEVMGVTRYWRYSKERMNQLIAEGRIVQTKPGAVPAYKRYLDEMFGVPIQDLWTDIRPIGAQAAERLGYPTQKPEALLERIIAASSNKGDVVLDPFCGCGTTVAVAQKLKRRWIGIDITHLAVNLIKVRLQNAFGPNVGKTYRVLGEPTSLPDAAQLAKEDPWQFQWWALGLIGARPVEKKKGADKGIDGRLFFHDESEAANFKQVMVSVKAGQNLSVPMVRDLVGVVEREKSSGAVMGVLISMEPPTKPMRQEAAGAGFYKSAQGTTHPKIQLLTIEELLQGKAVDMPPWRDIRTFKKAPKSSRADDKQMVLSNEDE
ncbi:MAG: DNA methyltransferase [Phycisphaeraceae bacterium]